MSHQTRPSPQATPLSLRAFAFSTYILLLISGCIFTEFFTEYSGLRFLLYISFLFGAYAICSKLWNPIEGFVLTLILTSPVTVHAPLVLRHIDLPHPIEWSSFGFMSSGCLYFVVPPSSIALYLLWKDTTSHRS